MSGGKLGGVSIQKNGKGMDAGQWRAGGPYAELAWGYDMNTCYIAELHSGVTLDLNHAKMCFSVTLVNNICAQFFHLQHAGEIRDVIFLG